MANPHAQAYAIIMANPHAQAYAIMIILCMTDECIQIRKKRMHNKLVASMKHVMQCPNLDLTLKCYEYLQ